MNHSTILSVVGATSIFASGGLLGAAAVVNAQHKPVKTVTIDVGKGTKGDPGPAGPVGPAGPKGPSGGLICPTGFVVGKLIINHPGGHTAIITCLEA